MKKKHLCMRVRPTQTYFMTILIPIKAETEPVRLNNAGINFDIWSFSSNNNTKQTLNMYYIKSKNHHLHFTLNILCHSLARFQGSRDGVQVVWIHFLRLIPMENERRSNYAEKLTSKPLNPTLSIHSFSLSLPVPSLNDPFGAWKEIHRVPRVLQPIFNYVQRWCRDCSWIDDLTRHF